MNGLGAHSCTNNAQMIDPSYDPKFEIKGAVEIDLKCTQLVVTFYFKFK